MGVEKKTYENKIKSRFTARGQGDCKSLANFSGKFDLKLPPAHSLYLLFFPALQISAKYIPYIRTEVPLPRS